MTDERPTRVLNVDDSNAGRYATTRVLTNAGFDVVEASTGEEALQHARALPDIVLLDVNLPDMSGLDVCARIKADPATATVPVVHLSATYIAPEHRSEGLEGGADAYLTQPVDPRELVATLQAVTRLYETRRELHESNELLNAIVQSSSDAIYVKDLEGRYLFFNAAAEKYTGKRADEVLGHDDTAVFPEEEAREMRERDGRAMHAGAPGTFEEQVTTASGELRTFLSVKGPLHDARGRVFGLFGVARDITERARAEERVRRLNEELEQRVAQRTEELELANRELEAFAYSVSHDLRAPLRAIDGFSQIAMEDAAALDEELRDNLTRVRAAAQRMGALIDDLLRLSRLTSKDLVLQRIDLTAIANNAVTELRVESPGRDVTVAVAEGLACHGDPELLRIVLVNLLANAWKFTAHHDSAHIEVGGEQVAGERRFYVRDDGAGFDMAYADKLFGAFQRLHAATDFPGNGVGLSIVQRIVRRHHGRVWADGAPEQGATFWFSVPEQPTA